MFEGLDENSSLFTPHILHKSISRRLLVGEPLFSVDEPINYLFQIQTGQVKLVRFTLEGHETLLHFARAGQFIAEASLFATHYHCDAIAAEPTEIIGLSKQNILNEFIYNPQVAQQFLRVLARQVMSLRTQIERRNIRSSKIRILHYMQANQKKNGKIYLLGSLKDLAAELGLAHESLYRTLASLKAEGKITGEKGIYTLNI
jgi:CRP/FNR family transcriptional regulator, dissimilatory nitrate respiration regulator